MGANAPNVNARAPMNTIGKAAVVGAACAACCAVPLAASLLAGSAAASLALPSWGLWLGAGLAGTAGFLLWRKRKRASGCSSAADCGCPPSDKIDLASATQPPTPQPVENGPPAFCSLTDNNYARRVATIQALSEKWLREAHRAPFQLRLSYAAEAATELQDLVHQERSCCAPVDFALHQDKAGVHLTIRLPAQDGESTEELFQQFVPPAVQARLSVSATI